MQGTCWNGSPYQPVPVAEDVRQQVAVSIMEQGEDFPAVLVEQQNVRAYPSPYGINAAHLLGYLSPITEDELDAAEDEERHLRPRRLRGRPGRPREAVRQVPPRLPRLQAGRGRLDGTRARQHRGDRGRRRRHPGHLASTRGSRPSWSSSSSRRSSTARKTFDHVTGKNYVADSGAAVVMDATQRTHRGDGRPADVRPRRLGRRDHLQGAGPALLREGRHAAAVPRHPGPVRARARPGSR